MLFTQNVLFLLLRVRFFLFWFWATVIAAIAAVAATDYKCVLNALRFLSFKSEMYVYNMCVVRKVMREKYAHTTTMMLECRSFGHSIWCISYNCTIVQCSLIYFELILRPMDGSFDCNIMIWATVNRLHARTYTLISIIRVLICSNI